MHGVALQPTRQEPVAETSATAYVWFIASVAALGGLLFGYDFVVIGGARQFYEEYFHLTSSALVGWANSCALLGCLLGSLVSGYTADRYGRKRLLIVAAILFGVSSLLTGWASTFTLFIVWRIAGGIAIGIASNVSPTYIAEVSPAAHRGRLVSLNQFAIVVGILLAQVANVIIARPETIPASHAWNVETGWRWMFYAVAVPSLLFLFGAIFLPESPRWLAARGRLAETRAILQRIEGSTNSTVIAAQEDQQAQEVSSGWGTLLQSPYRRALSIAVALAVLQQWTGINILFNYASEVYRKAGYSGDAILFNIVITGAINLLATILAMFLVDSIGRRRLMLAGCLGIATAHLLCAWAYARGVQGAPILILTLAAIGCFACTLAPVTWVLIAEIFPNTVRSRGVSVAVSALWIACFVLTYTFPFLQASLGSAGTFALYGVICLAGFVLVQRTVTETRGISLESMGKS